MIDLHLHASGASSSRVLWTLVKESGFKTKAKNYWEFQKLVTMNKSEVDSLDDYLSVLHDIDLVQSSPRAIELSFYEAYLDSYLAGCSFLEMRFNPVKRSQNNKLDLDSLIVAARAGKERAKNYFGIDGSIALCMGRDCTQKANEAIAQKAITYVKKGISTLDVAGSENLPLQRYFEDIYKDAKKAGLNRTIHIGETKHDKTEEELEFVLTKLKPDRVGHGIQIVNYPDLMRLASLNGTLFEICITSNLTSRAVSSLDEYAKIMKTFERYNLKYTVATDATHAIDTNIRKENQLMEEIKNIARN